MRSIIPGFLTRSRKSRAQFLFVSFHPFLWHLLILLGVVTYGSYAILVNLCKINGKILFSSASQVFLTEFTKLVISVLMSVPEVDKMDMFVSGCYPSVFLPFMVPALLYCFNNNISVHMQTQMDPTTFQILCNLKILSTALLYRVIIKRHLSRIQWFAIFLLFSAGVCNSVGALELNQATARLGSDVFITIPGLIMITMHCLCSGLASVYSEYILKKHKTIPLSIQNAILYVYGVVVNGSIFLLHNNAKDLFEGYTAYTWLLIISQTTNGLVISAVMKHSSNITRLFMISGAMVYTTFMSVIVFATALNLFVVVACCLVIAAVTLYYKQP